MKGPKDKKEARGAVFSLPGVDVDQLEHVLAFMAAHGLEEFEYEHGGTHIRLRRASAMREQPAHTATATTPKLAAPIAMTPEAARPAPTPQTVPAPSQPAEELRMIKSPIVGTFYSSPSPDAAPFVKPGDSVHAGQVVCIIEAMKLMNEIEADVGGKVARVLVENGQPVEYGQELFAIRPE